MSLKYSIRKGVPAVHDRGAVLLWFSVMAVAMLGMGALVVDVGALWSERRQLQNGADAAALAVALECAGGDCAAPQQVADQYADFNADDGSSDVISICGKPSPLSICPPPPGAEDVLGFVKVVTSTRTSGGSDEVAFKLAPALDASNDGQNVTASAAVAWGVPKGAPVLPFVFSKCAVEQFRNQIDNSLNFPQTITRIDLHLADAALDDTNTCTITGNDGTEVQWPSGFGFTGSASTGCGSEVVELDPSADGSTQTGTIEGENEGASISLACEAELIRRYNAGEPIIVPIMFWRTGTGSNTIWEIDGFVAIEICAFDIKGNDGLEFNSCLNPDNSPDAVCAPVRQGGQDVRRMCGRFTPYVLTDGEIGGGTDYGTRVIKMIG